MLQDKNQVGEAIAILRGYNENMDFVAMASIAEANGRGKSLERKEEIFIDKLDHALEYGSISERDNVKKDKAKIVEAYKIIRDASEEDKSILLDRRLGDEYTKPFRRR